MSELGDDLGRRLDSLRAIFERELRAEATRERVIDRLHAELQEYKQDLLLKVQRPIFVDLIQLHDDMGKMIEARSASDAGELQAAAVRGILESIQTAIEDILYRQGVEPFALEGNEFDAASSGRSPPWRPMTPCSTRPSPCGSAKDFSPATS